VQRRPRHVRETASTRRPPIATASPRTGSRATTVLLNLRTGSGSRSPWAASVHVDAGDAGDMGAVAGLRTGVLTRTVRWRSPGGVTVEIEARRLVSLVVPASPPSTTPDGARGGPRRSGWCPRSMPRCATRRSPTTPGWAPTCREGAPAHVVPRGDPGRGARSSSGGHADAARRGRRRGSALGATRTRRWPPPPRTSSVAGEEGVALSVETTLQRRDAGPDQGPRLRNVLDHPEENLVPGPGRRSSPAARRLRHAGRGASGSPGPVSGPRPT